jgi:hypothetical protein
MHRKHSSAQYYKIKGKCWSEFYRFVNRRKGNRENIPKGNRENIPTIKDCNGGLISDPVDKANNLNVYV